ncbi:MAG: LPXTG cell wall anchor domain-containing protein [Propionibacteriaceae bacterium]|jgi:LPXTG-motif cell wall-anchored protein|nr:LPXTG cell wall anchor domain-containing protein [Propionibacteriaceae bacterium]
MPSYRHLRLGRGLALGLAFGLALGWAATTVAQGDPTDPVVIDDPVLAACVESALGLSPDQSPTEAEAAALTSLTCAGVADLTALAHFNGLIRLDLGGASATDVTALASLTALRWLDLSDAPLSDLTPLAGADFSLAVLKLEGTAVSDLTPLAGRFRSAAGIYLDGAHVTDLRPLAGGSHQIVANDQTVALAAQVGQAVPLPQIMPPAGPALVLTPVAGQGSIDPVAQTVTYAEPGEYQLSWQAEDAGDYVICDIDDNCFQPGYVASGRVTIRVSAVEPLPGSGPALPDTGAPAQWPALAGLAGLLILLGLGCLFQRRRLV